MLSKLLRRPVLAMMAIAISALGVTVLGPSVSAYASSFCATSGNFKSCIEASGGTVSAVGSGNGNTCFLFAAHEELSGPGGTFNTPSKSHYCGATLQLGTTETSGNWCATLWEGPNGSGTFTKVAEECHSF